jgi:hypothetical protein
MHRRAAGCEGPYPRIHMRSQDFLQRHAETHFCERYTAAGAVFSLSTNCDKLLAAARGSFLPAEAAAGPSDFSLRFWVDDDDAARSPWPKPHLRGLDNLVFVGLDAKSSMLVDLRNRRVIGRFSAAMAGDGRYWNTVIFPMLVSILAGSLGIVELHASCVASEQHGLVLIGPSRSGKSTLALALIEAGFRFLSDDRIFCSLCSLTQQKLLAYGLPRPLKLRREAAAWFEEFRDRESAEVQNGEPVFFCEPDRQFRQNGLAACEPRALVFLERHDSPGFHLAPMKPSEIKSSIELELLAEDPSAVEKQEKTLDSLLTLPCWRLRYGGRPQAIADQLAASFLSSELNNSEYRSQGGTT